MESNARHSGNIMCTLFEKELEHFGIRLYAKPVNRKLPLFEIEDPPKEYKEDCEFKSRNPGHRYYIVKYKDWRLYKKTPLGEVVDCIGEGGNLKSEV